MMLPLFLVAFPPVLNAPLVLPGEAQKRRTAAVATDIDTVNEWAVSGRAGDFLLLLPAEILL